jgi:hypothetical protein
LLLCIGVALFRRSANAVVEGSNADVPMRLLRWAAGLLSAQRHQWGQAMLGELDHIEGRGRRWRFTIGCIGAALLLPPWGRAGAAVVAMLAVAMGGLGLYASVLVRYQRGGDSWIAVTIVSIVLLCFVVAATVLLRRPGVAVPGLLGGLFVALVWIAMSGFTFTTFITRVWAAWAVPLLFFAVPAAVGVIGTLWRGSAVAGRRTARLAGISAGLGLYLYGTLAVAVVGAGGQPVDSGFTVTSTVTDRLGNNIIFYLALLPLVTATFGWAAAAATAHIRPQVATADAAPFAATGVVEAIPRATGSAGAARGAPRRMHVVLQCTVAAGAVLLVGATLLAS